MALAVVATFTNLPEAQVAASALRSGGIDAIVMDEHFGVAMWVEQFALQGFRVAVPGDQLTDARAFFKELTPPRPRRAPPRSPVQKAAGAGWRLGSVLTAFFLFPYAGWLIVGAAHRRPKGSVAAMLTGTLLVAGAAIAAILLLRLLMGLFPNLAAPPY